MIRVVRWVRVSVRVIVRVVSVIVRYGLLLGLL